MAVLRPPTDAAYLARLLGGLAIMLALCAALTLLADPYYLFGTPERLGLQLPRPNAAQEAEAAKTALLHRSPCPHTLILGNSRAELGIDAASPAWPPAARPVFNAALAGTGPGIAVRMLETATRACHIQTILFITDFIDTLYRQDPAPIPTLADHAALYARATLSLDALTDSAKTLLRIPGGRDLQPNGTVILNDYRSFTAQHGYAALFEVKRRSFADQIARAPLFAAAPEGPPPPRIIATLIDEAARNGGDLVLAIPPYHAEFMAALTEAGLLGRFAAWRQSLITLARTARARGVHLRLLDFSPPSAFTTEPIPTDLTPMRYYWELGHFKTALGDAIIARLTAETGFGQDLLAP